MHEAEAIFLGTFDIHIPANTINVVEQGSCSIPAQWNMVNLWPHMHSYAKHQRVTVRRNSNGAIDTLVDANYSYMDQKNYPMPNVLLNPNDELRIECTYDNMTAQEVTYGDSAIQEMCFAGFYKWPSNGLSKYLLLAALPRQLLARGFRLEHELGARAVLDDLAGHDAFLDARQRRDLVHHVEHHFFEDGAQAARARLAAARLLGDRA